MNIAAMMKQAQQMQSKLAAMQETLAAQEFTGTAAGGKVAVTMTGKGEARKVKIDPSLCSADDVDMLEDLIAVAINDARTKIDEASAAETQKAMGGMSLPAGLKLPF